VDIEREKPNISMTNDFKTLFNHMIHPNPANRASLSDVLASNWFNIEESVTLEEVRTLFLDRNLGFINVGDASLVCHSRINSKAVLNQPTSEVKS
jgi:serine/threonine protein kinase